MPTFVRADAGNSPLSTSSALARVEPRYIRSADFMSPASLSLENGLSFPPAESLNEYRSMPYFSRM